MKYGRKFTSEHISFIKERITGNTYKDVAKMFKNNFGIELSKQQIIGLIRRNGLHNGLKGYKKAYLNGIKTRYKKGSKPWQYKPIGSERACRGVVDIKIAEPNTWKSKHTLIWENEHGKVPKGYVVIFADSDKNNFNIDNLLLVKRNELLIMNAKGYITKDTELTKVGKAVAGLNISIRNHVGGENE